jgi:hypothetical protein
MADNITIHFEFNTAILDQIVAATPAKVEMALDKIVGDIEATAKASMSGSKTGRFYQTGNITRRLLRSERSQVAISKEFGKLFMRIDGMRVEQAGKGFKVVTGAKVRQASAPGETPAVDTSNLKNSWVVLRSKGRRTFGFAAEYAPHLEYGTIHMAARPFFLPAIVRGSSGMIQRATAITDSGKTLGDFGGVK